MLYELMGHANQYLIRECTLRDLESWLIANLQAILDSGDQKTINLANQIDADLVDLSESLVDQTGFDEQLRIHLRVTEILRLWIGATVLEAHTETRTETSSRTIFTHLTHQAA